MSWRSQRDFEDELRSHIELETDRLIAEGFTPNDARSTARRKFGNLGAAQERFSDASGFDSLFDLAKDVRHAGRDVVTLVGISVIGISGLGVAIGILGAVAGSGIMKKLIFDIAAVDVVTYVACAATLLGAAGLAAFMPTLRATRVDPARTIRAQ